MPILREPLPPDVLAMLRTRVLQFRQGQHRRVFPASVIVGRPRGFAADLELTSYPTRGGAVSSGDADDVSLPHGCTPWEVRLDQHHLVKQPPRSRRFKSLEVDAAQRADVVGVLLDRVLGEDGDGPPMMWLTRPGEVGWHVDDAAWVAAGRQAFGECGVDLTLVVITRQGWRDPRSGVTRTWLRLRAR